MSELTKEKIYKKELEKVGGEGNNNLERIRSLAGGSAFEDIVDKNGNQRFIEGAGIPKTNLPGLTISYCKWSLSGTHLMLVCAGAVENETVFTTGNIATFNLPNWVLNKIYPVWANQYIEKKDIALVADNFTEQSTPSILVKSETSVTIYVSSAVTLTANRGFRVQFDLLIDNE